MPKLIYIANIRVPTEKAHGIQIMTMCEALARAAGGFDLELVVPARFNSIKQDPFVYYGVKPLFKIKRLPVVDLIFLNIPLAFLLETLTFTISLFFYLLFQRDYILYTRGEMILGLKPFLKEKPVFWETHIKPRLFSPYQKILDKIKGLVVVTDYYRRELIEKYYLAPRKVIWAPDGVDLEKFDIIVNRQEARDQLSLPQNKKIILYTGSFLSWKGADIFLRVASLLPDDSLLVLVAGGEREAIERFKNFYKSAPLKNILILEHQPHEKIPLYLKAADVLVLTGTQKSDTSLYYTSPLKLFEYLAADRPILAADIPSFREILSEDKAFFYQADQPADFIEQIKFIFGDYAAAEERARRALQAAREFSWQKRAEKILGFIAASEEQNGRWRPFHPSDDATKGL